MSLLDSAMIACPYCGETIELAIEPGMAEQEFIEDCHVCCRPIQLYLQEDAQGQFTVVPRHEDEV